jgi:transcriptional regulator with XRE-family HTH domain
VRSTGTTAAGGYVGGELALPNGRPAADMDALRERREAERAALAAKNPFAQPSGLPRTLSTSRLHSGALHNPEYEKASFATPPPAPLSLTEEVPVSAPKPTPRPPLKPAAPPITRERPAVDAAAFVLLHVDDGLDAAAIATMKGVPEAEVQRILDETPTPAPSRETNDAALVERVRRLYVEEGLSQRAVAEQLGIHQTHVSRILRANKIPTRAFRKPAKKADPRPPSKVAAEVVERPGATAAASLEVAAPPPAVVELAAPPPAAAVLYTADLEEARQSLAKHAQADLTEDDLDELVSVLHDADVARTVAHSLGATTLVLDATVRRATEILDAAVRHELETVRLLQEARR